MFPYQRLWLYCVQKQWFLCPYHVKLHVLCVCIDVRLYWVFPITALSLDLSHIEDCAAFVSVCWKEMEENKMEENKIKAYFVLTCIGDSVLEWLPLGPTGKIWVIYMVYAWSHSLFCLIFLSR